MISRALYVALQAMRLGLGKNMEILLPNPNYLVCQFGFSVIVLYALY